MSRFSLTTPKAVTLVPNVAGGMGDVASARRTLAAIATTSFVTDEFYRSAPDTVQTILDLASRDPRFAMQTALAARHVFHMRTTSHIIAAGVARATMGLGDPHTRKFIANVVSRPDDMVEILAAYLTFFGSPLPNALKRGLADAFDKFDAYALGKYRSEGKTVSLVDVVNLVHPHPTIANASALADLVAGKLRSTDTWERAFSEAGAKADKAAIWFDLISREKLGLFALIRNLRNIEETQNTHVIKAASDMLRKPGLVAAGKVLPFRFAEAMKHVSNPHLLASLDIAITRSVHNIELDNMDGTLVALDDSGSMTGKPWDVGSVFAAAFALRGADVMLFSDDARPFKPTGTSMTQHLRQLNNMRTSSGTNFNSIFKRAARGYNRIIILSDMQGWMDDGTDIYYSKGTYLYGGSPREAHKEYKGRTNSDPLIISWDLAHYGTGMFPESKVVTLFGWSDAALSALPYFEKGGDGIVQLISEMQI